MSQAGLRSLARSATPFAVRNPGRQSNSMAYLERPHFRAFGEDHQMRETGEDSVLIEYHAAVAVITLNEPKSLNALSAGIKAGLESALLNVLSSREVRAIVITGAGEAFCAGGDLRAMDDRTPAAALARMGRNHRWLIPLLTADKPIVSAVNGFAVGAGFSLALTGDVVVASENALFKAGFPRIGLAPDLGLAYTLPRAVGMNQAGDILLTNKDVGAEEALRLGIATRLCARGSLIETALSIASNLSAGPAFAYGLTKQLLRRTFDGPLEAFLEAEAAAQALAFGSKDFAEGVEAFASKRKPVFTGE
jgi:2-(1,2-epoxy-1,2-dihydrophenyl)acetyl-CoA isomerase